MKAKKPSAEAVVVAASMRSFDRGLRAGDIAAIAEKIDAQRAMGALLSPKKKRLRNSDEPLTSVQIRDRDR